MKKSTIILISGFIVLLAVYVGFTDKVVNLGDSTPKELKLKCDKSKIRNATDTGSEVVYQCLSDEKVETEPGEDISKRTGNAKFYKKGKKDGKDVWEGKFYGGETFVKEGGDWYTVEEVATTTKDEYQKQTKLSFFERMIGEYAVADTSTTTGQASYEGSARRYNASYSTAHNSSVGNATSTNLLIETFFTSSYYYINRTFLPFDTSSLPDDATLSSSTLYFVVEGYYDYGDVGTRKLALVQTSQPDNTVLTLADYNECGATTSPAEGADQVQYTATGTYAFTLNATGTSWISQTGITKLGIRSHLDVADTAPTDGVTELYVYLDKSNVADINKRPNLTIEYTTGGGEPEATASSCLPVAGQNWWMNLADNCISSTTIMHDKPIYCYGTGSWTIDGVTVQVTGTSSLCIPTVKSGAMEVEDLKEYIVNDLDQTIDSLDQGAGRFIIKL